MQDDLDLDGLFAEARSLRPDPSPALLARIAGDAAREQPRAAALAPPPAPRPERPRGWGLVLADLFGGGGGLAGLTLAAASGLWIGVAQPAALSSVTDYLTGSSGMELLPSETALWAGE